MRHQVDSDHRYTLRAKLSHPDLGEIGEGSITFGYGCVACFVLDGFGRDIVLSESQLAAGLLVIAEDGRRLSLFNCECRGSTLFPAFVVGGDVKVAQFQSFEVRYSDVSEWFFQQMHVDGEPGKGIEWRTLPPPLVAEVAQPGHNFKSESFYVGSLSQQGEDRNLHQHFEFRFTATQDRFSLDEIQNYALRFSNLLSILLAHPCLIVSIDVSVDGNHGARLYYSIFKSSQNENRGDASDDRITWRTFFTRKSDVDACWGSVVNKFFNSKYREVIWARVAGMQRYEGFWEYRVLSYVTLLDGYVSQAFKKGLVLTKTKNLRRLEAELADIQPRLSQAQQSSVMAAAMQIFASKASFESKFQQLLDEMDSDVRMVIRLAQSDFETIKDLRDEIAHGQRLTFEGSDLTPLLVITSRVVLLLMYRFFCDVGLGRRLFLEGLSMPLCKLRREADIDEVHLDRVLKPEKFFSVSEREMGLIRGRSHKLYCFCFTRDRDGLISYSERYSELSQNNLRARQTGAHHELLDLPEDAVRYVGTAYFDDGTHVERVHSTLLIDLANVPD